MSIEGLNALIQLEATKLEGAKMVSQNNQQINSTIQQQGLQTAQSRQNISLQEIQGRYDKEVAEAEVKRLESRLTRERQAEKLALLISVGVGAGSLASGLWDFGKDLFGGGQDLGDISKSLQSPPLDPGRTQTMVYRHPDSATDTVYMAGYNDDGSETVQSFSRIGNGTVPDNSLRSATITGEDKARILGEGYRDKSFAQIYAEDPDKAEKLMADKHHGLAKGEAESFIDAVHSNPELNDYNDALNDTLAASGKIDNSGFFGKIGEGAKGLTNVLVQTAEATVPYLQAYMAAKSRADGIEEELEAAKRKLEAANRKLKQIEESIDAFAGRGS